MHVHRMSAVMEEENEQAPLSVEVSWASDKDGIIDNILYMVSLSSEYLTFIITVDVQCAWKMTAAHVHSQLGPWLSNESF